MIDSAEIFLRRTAIEYGGSKISPLSIISLEITPICNGLNLPSATGFFVIDNNRNFFVHELACVGWKVHSMWSTTAPRRRNS